jgi:hypothetical protein
MLALLALAGSAFVLFFRLRAEREREEELVRRARTRRVVAAGRIGDLESATDPSMLTAGEHRTTRRFAAADGEDEGEEYAGAGWDEDEGPGPDWQPRPMTGSMPIFADESYPRASSGGDDEQTGAGAPTSPGAADIGATVASEPSSEDGDPARDD